MTAKSSLPRIAICMGSQSDWSTMKAAADILDQFGAAHEVKSFRRIAHRTFIQICRNRA
jgi:5-(carboxyamino)imidazole ribonucleotide mutase